MHMLRTGTLDGHQNNDSEKEAMKHAYGQK